MKKILISFLLCLNLLFFLQACGESDKKDGAAASQATSNTVALPQAEEERQANLPVDGDYYISGTIGEPSNLIPALSSDSASSEINAKIYNGLMKVDKSLNIVPDLAESLEISEDGLKLTFKLRQDVRWHDGEAFKSKDVIFTYKLMVDPKTPTAYAEPFLQIKSIEAPDDYTVIVYYDQALARALVSWCFDIMPAHLLEGQKLEGNQLSRHPIGTGPYKFEKWDSGQRLILKANDDYFEGRPHIDQLVIKVIPDLNAQMMELVSGQLDSMGLTPDQYEEKENDRSFKQNYNVYRYQSFAYTYLGFNLKDPKFQDKKVRQAIAYAIDKDEIIEGVLLGFGQAANGPFKPDMWANNKDVKPYPYDPVKAKALLAEAGWKDTNGDGILDKGGQPFQFTIMSNQGNKVRENTALIIQARLAAIGIKVNIRIVEWAAFLKEYIDKHNFEALIMAWTIPIEPDLFDVWHSSKINPGELNYISYQNEEVDRLIDKARFTLDRTIRKAALDRIQEIFYEEVPYVFLFVPDALPAVSKRFIGPEVGPAGLGHNFKDWYVPLDKQRYKP